MPCSRVAVDGTTTTLTGNIYKQQSPTSVRLAARDQLSEEVAAALRCQTNSDLDDDVWSANFYGHLRSIRPPAPADPTTTPWR